MTGCTRARRRLWAYLQHGTRERWVADHLHDCPPCAAEAARIEHAGATLRSAAHTPEAPDAARVWAGIAPRLPQRRRFPLRVWIPLAPAALLAALWMGGTGDGGRGTGPETGRAGDVAAVARGGVGAHAGGGPARSTADSRRLHHAAARVPAGARGRDTRPSGVAAAHGSGRIGRIGRTRGLGRVASSPLHPFIPSPLHTSPVSRLPSPVPEPAGIPAPLRLTEPGGGAAPVAAVMVVRAPVKAGAASLTRSFTRSEVADPVTGATSRLAVTREVDASGAARRVTIEYEVRNPSVGGVGSET